MIASVRVCEAETEKEKAADAYTHTHTHTHTHVPGRPSHDLNYVDLARTSAYKAKRNRGCKGVEEG